MTTTDQPTITASGTTVAPSPTQQVQDTSSIWYNVNTLLRDIGVMLGFVPIFLTLWGQKDLIGFINTIHSQEFLVPAGALVSAGIIVWRQFKAWKTEAKVMDK